MSTYYFGKSEKLEKFGALELPVFKVEANKDWVINGTIKGWINLQSQYYNFLYQTSTKHHAIVDSKSRYTYGKGWAVDGLGLGTAELIELKSFLKKVEKNKVTQRCILDRIIQGGFAVELIYDEAGEKVYPYHVDFSCVRESKPEYEKDGKTLKPTLYFYTSDWKKQNPKTNSDFVTFHAFDPNEKADSSKRYLVYYKDYRPDLGAYPYPEYMGGLPYIQADAEVGNFVYNNVKNGFSAGYIFNFYNGDLTEDQRGAIEAQLKASKHGTENAGQPFVAFNNAGDKGVEVSPIQANGQDDRYKQLNEQIRDEIFTAHAVSPLVVGMKGDNGFSNNADEIRTAVENFTEGYVKPVQDIFNEFMNGIIDFNEIKGNVYLARLDPIQEQLSEATLLQIASLSEIRDKAGLPKIESETNKIADSLKSLSPLVANKVLESMSPAEIRSLIGLETTEPIVRTTVTESKEFSSDINIGIKDEDYELLFSEEHHFASIEDAVSKQETFRQTFASKLESSILGALQNNPDLTSKELAELLKTPKGTINKTLKSLETQGLISGGVVTPEGELEIEEFKIVYKYKVRNDVPPVESTSRPFCIKYMRISQTRSFSIEDINLLSALEGYDVFAKRGGWYHNPDTDKTTDYCRHVWEQRLVRLK